MDTNNMDTMPAKQETAKKAIIEVTVKSYPDAAAIKPVTYNHVCFASSTSEVEDLIKTEYDYSFSYKITSFKDKEVYTRVLYNPDSYCESDYKYKVIVEQEEVDERGSSKIIKQKFIVVATCILDAHNIIAKEFDGQDYRIKTIDEIKINTFLGKQD